MSILSNSLHRSVPLSTAGKAWCRLCGGRVSFIKGTGFHKTTLQNPNTWTIRWVKWRSDHTFFYQVFLYMFQLIGVSDEQRLSANSLTSVYHFQQIHSLKKNGSDKGLHDPERNLIDIFQDLLICLYLFFFTEILTSYKQDFFCPSFCSSSNHSAKSVWKPIIKLCHDQWIGRYFYAKLARYNTTSLL